MLAKVIRYMPSSSLLSDPVTRLYIPARRLVVARNMFVRRGTVSGGEVLAELDVGDDFVKLVERVLESQSLLEQKLHSRPYRALLRALQI